MWDKEKKQCLFKVAIEGEVNKVSIVNDITDALNSEPEIWFLTESFKQALLGLGFAEKTILETFAEAAKG